MEPSKLQFSHETTTNNSKSFQWTTPLVPRNSSNLKSRNTGLKKEASPAVTHSEISSVKPRKIDFVQRNKAKMGELSRQRA